VVEFAMESCLDGPCQGQTNGTVNPGLIWFGDYIQMGLAAQVPVNHRTASNVVPDRKPRFFEKSAHNLGFGLCIFRWTGRPIALAGRPARNGPCRGRFSGAASPARLAGDATLSVAQAAFW
jgi:hypothetical protein